MDQEEPSQPEAMEESIALEELTTTKAIFTMSRCDGEYKTLIGINKFIIMPFSQKQHKWTKKKKKPQTKNQGLKKKKQTNNSVWTVKSN